MSSPAPLLPILKSLADPTRLALVDVLSRGSFNVSELCFALELGQSTVSRHLRILLDASVVALRKEGREAYYRLETEPVPPLLTETLRHLNQDRAPDRDARLSETWERRRRRSRVFFDNLAPETGEGRADYLGSPDCVPLLLRLLEHGNVVADVGTGTGRLLPDLAPHARTIIAVDASQSMLDRARETAGSLESADVDFRLGDIEHLPLADGEADRAVAHMVLHHAPDPGRAVAELSRALAPGGMVLVGDFLPHENQWMREEMADQWLGLDESDIRLWLARAGLREITFERVQSEASSMGVFVATAKKPNLRNQQ